MRSERTCAAYVASQKAESWVLLPTVYEDAGLSGGTLERPGLQRLLADINAGLVEQIVVYKVDRLTCAFHLIHPAPARDEP